jgi:peptide chain release factor 1
VTSWALTKVVASQIADDRAALADPELREMAEEELPQLVVARGELEKELELLLLPRDPNDARNTIVEIRSGHGRRRGGAVRGRSVPHVLAASPSARAGRWRSSPLSEASSGGGSRRSSASVTGAQVYSRLRFEGGVHRVQRVPATESQGRIHTSTATVAVLPEADEVDVEIDDKDLEISIAASGGPGGQGVNTTNSAVQILHIARAA